MDPVDRTPDTGPRQTDPAAQPATTDSAATERYQDLIRSVHREWDDLEARGDSSVQLSPRAIASIKEAVRLDTRHGAQVTMPPTDAGPYTVTELTLRTLLRSAIDAVPGALALRTSFEFAEDSSDSVRVRGMPVRVLCRISARVGTPDLPGLADQVRDSVRQSYRTNLDLRDAVVDIHIEDLHEYSSR